MNIVICIKQTFDTEAKIALTAQGEIDTHGVKLIINPYDEYAIEEAIQLKEKWGGEVTVISFGESRVQEALRSALAMGADKAILIDHSGIEKIDEWVTAEVLAQALKNIPFDVLLAGRIAVDDGSAQVAVRLAEKLDLPCISNILKLEINGEVASCIREIDGGSESVDVPLPAVFTAQKGLNNPRYPTVVNIMKAKKKPLDVISINDLGLNPKELEAKILTVGFTLPDPRQAAHIFSGDAQDASRQLAKLLREEVKII